MLRRLVYLAIVVLWLVLMTLPVLAFLLAARGELMIGSDQGSNVRLFMVNDIGATGIGFQRVRKSGSDDDCLRTSVRYLLWEGRSKEFNTDFCTCFDADTGYADAADSCDGAAR